MEVFYDKHGIIRNIGPWDYKQELDEYGVPFDANPLPPDHYSVDEEVITHEDGSRSVVPRTGE